MQTYTPETENICTRMQQSYNWRSRKTAGSWFLQGRLLSRLASKCGHGKEEQW